MNSLPKWKRHYLRRRAKVIDYLGGICAKCGSLESLEFDHVNPEQKSFSVGTVLTHSWAKIEPELKKCQLLCQNCHKRKSKNDGSLEKMKKSFKKRKPQDRDEQGRFVGGQEHGPRDSV